MLPAMLQRAVATEPMIAQPAVWRLLMELMVGLNALTIAWVAAGIFPTWL